MAPAEPGYKISIVSPEVKTAGDSIEDIAAKTLLYIKRSAAKEKDKSKAKMEEFESAMTKDKRHTRIESHGYEVLCRCKPHLLTEEGSGLPGA
ncbi:hypothetical protein Tco_0406949 [Tanacetum coccineum]